MSILSHNISRTSRAHMMDAEHPPQTDRSKREPTPAVRNTSALLVNPLDARHIVGVEEVTSPDGAPSISARVSFDDGTCWRESWPLPLNTEWAGVVGPVLAIDAHGTVNLAALALDADRSRASLVIYRSEDGGIHWDMPAVVLWGSAECCYSIAVDLNPGSPFRGSVYLAADMGNTLCFALSSDGQSWDGRSLSAAGSQLFGLCCNPEVLVDAEGGVHMIWMTGPSGCNILAVHSADGGDTFSAPVTVAEGIGGVREGLPETVPATCIAADGVSLCVWADDREGRARIYRRRSLDGGRTWQGPVAGEPLAGGEASGQHEFQPHLIETAGGEFCCAFYEYGAKTAGAELLVNLAMVVSYDRGQTFRGHMVLSERPWNPAEDQPLSREATRGALGGLMLG